MSGQYGFDDCPSEIRAQIERLQKTLKWILGGWRGLYLHGSLATGCFNPARSDLDLLVATDAPMTLAQKRAVAGILLAESRVPAPVEISFLRPADLAPWRHPTPFDYHFSEDWRAATRRALDDDSWRRWNESAPLDDDLAAHITVLRHRGIRLDGAPIEEVFPVVPAADFADSILGDVFSDKFGLDAVARIPVYVVLNACRTLAYLETGRVLSKAEGGAWARERLPDDARAVIDAALAEYATDAPADFAPKELADFGAVMKRKISARLAL